MMRIAFHAPMKPPTHPSPSGDRRMARLLIAAFEAAGHTVELASAFRTYDASGDADRQKRLGVLGGRLAERLIRRYRTRPQRRRPDAWFTYHLYHKAPDLLGPAVTRALGIPYLVAEASNAPKQKDGPWAVGYRAAARAITAADILIGLNSSDRESLLPLLDDPNRLVTLRPFLDTAPYMETPATKSEHRRGVSARHGIDESEPWLLSVAMMRGGGKLASYRVLGKALSRLPERRWRLLVAGDGPARAEVEAALAPLGERVYWFGELNAAKLAALYAASDLFVWPAVNEAYGMVFLEAQASGLPVVAGRTGGVPDVVGDGESGILAPVGDPEALAAAVGELLDDDSRRLSMGLRARQRVAAEHGLDDAAAALNGFLQRAIEGKGTPA